MGLTSQRAASKAKQKQFDSRATSVCSLLENPPHSRILLRALRPSVALKCWHSFVDRFLSLNPQFPELLLQALAMQPDLRRRAADIAVIFLQPQRDVIDLELPLGLFVG